MIHPLNHHYSQLVPDRSTSAAHSRRWLLQHSVGSPHPPTSPVPWGIPANAPDTESRPASVYLCLDQLAPPSYPTPSPPPTQHHRPELVVVVYPAAVESDSCAESP